MSKGDKFVEHLEELAQAYGPDLSDLPTADQILNGLLYPKGDLTFDQQIALITSCNELMLETYEKYGEVVILQGRKIRRGKQSIVFDEKLENYVVFIQALPVELQVYAIKTLSTQCGMLVARPGSRIWDLLEAIGPFYNAGSEDEDKLS